METNTYLQNMDKQIRMEKDLEKRMLAGTVQPCNQDMCNFQAQLIIETEEKKSLQVQLKDKSDVINVAEAALKKNVKPQDQEKALEKVSAYLAVQALEEKVKGLEAKNKKAEEEYLKEQARVADLQQQLNESLSFEEANAELKKTKRQLKLDRLEREQNARVINDQKLILAQQAHRLDEINSQIKIGLVSLKDVQAQKKLDNKELHQLTTLKAKVLSELAKFGKSLPDESEDILKEVKNAEKAQERLHPKKKGWLRRWGLLILFGMLTIGFAVFGVYMKMKSVQP